MPEDSIQEFFEIVERQDFHEMARAGREIFVEGLHISNHAALFEHFPSSEPDSGYVRYVFYSFQGEASVGQVYLVLESDSGKIVEFGRVEAWLE